MENINLLTIFTTGLVTGGLTCMAVQGGLLAASIAQHEQERLQSHTEKSGNAVPILIFLVAKLFAYTALGGFWGWFGSMLAFSVQTQVVLQLFVVVFMIGTALNMLHVHPVFRYFALQPPRFLTRLIRRQSKRKDFFGPLLLGFFTVFIPCGTTQAMMALAIASAHPFTGAVVLFVFVLGTSPVFFLLGYLTTKLGDVLQSRFTNVAAAVIILLAVFNLNNAIALSGSRYTLQNILGAIDCAISFCPNEVNSPAGNQNPVTAMTILLTDAGYAPNQFTVKHGADVTLRLKNNEARGCIQAFTIPSLGIQKVVPPGTEETITFTAPETPGELAFTCSMGMYPGTIKVI